MKLTIEHQDGTGMPHRWAHKHEKPVVCRNLDGQRFIRWVKIITLDYVPF
jgi:hypothetical protein